jgi:mycothiol synthase
MSIELREHLRPGDLETLASLTRESARPLSSAQITHLLLADPDLFRTRVLIAEEHGGILGYAHVGLDEGVAYLVSGVVAAAARRRGIGTRLLTAALEHARRCGARDLVVSGRPLAYAAPGVDEHEDPGTAAFLRARGARAGGAALAMQRDLEDLPDPAALPADVQIAPCTAEEVPEMLAAVRTHLAADWSRTLARQISARAAAALRSGPSADGPAGTILLARDTSTPEAPGEILGIAAWDVVGEDPERFGPIGVMPAARGRGVGGALLDRALDRMARAGAARAWFQWTSDSGPAHRLYLSRGFRPLGTSTPFTLPVPTTSPERTRS